MMNKFINDPDNLTAELLEGYVMAYSNQVAIGGENIIVRAHAKAEDKVAVITLGGSGHEPALSGFVGDGMLDCSVVVLPHIRLAISSADLSGKERKCRL